MTIVQHHTMLDFTAPESVEIEVRADGTVVWVNIDGICRLRACRMKSLRLTDAGNNILVLADLFRNLPDNTLDDIIEALGEVVDYKQDDGKAEATIALINGIKTEREKQEGETQDE